jgi:hypothetical protein
MKIDYSSQMRKNCEYKLAFSKNEVWHFAYLELYIALSDRSQVINSIEKPVNIKDAEFDEITHPDWFNAAVDGIQADRYFINRANGDKLTVQIVCLKGVEVDTKYDNIKTVAFLATMKNY